MSEMAHSGFVEKLLHLSLRALLLAAFLLPIAGCTKNEFTVEINLPENTDRTYILVYYASDKKKGWIKEIVVPVQKGKARVSCSTALPTLVYIMTDTGSEPQAIFYAERGDRIKIKGSGQNPAGWDISGNRITDDLTRFRLDKEANPDTPPSSPMEEEVLNKKIEKYVDANPSNPASAILLMTFYDRRSDDSGFRRLWKKLKKEAADVRWQELVARADLTGTFNPETQLPDTIVLKTFETGCDTIVSGKVPIILYFSKTGVASYRDNMNSLKKLSEEFPDSSARVIAEISFEPDSIQRRYAIQRDSLKSAMHAWMPLGVSDSLATRLNVHRIPFVVVIGRDGKKIYGGDDLRKGAEAFRKDMKIKKKQL